MTSGACQFVFYFNDYVHKLVCGVIDQYNKITIENVDELGVCVRKSVCVCVFAFVRVCVGTCVRG